MQRWEVSKPKGVFVIVHGAGEHHGRYEWTVNQLNKLNYNVIMGDLPGQGKTEGPRGHISSFNEYMVVVRKWLKEARQYRLPVVLLGHSMGGLISIHTLMDLNRNLVPSAVVLSSPCLGLANPPSVPVRSLAYLLNYCVPKYRVATKGNRGTRCEITRKKYDQDPLRVRKVSVRWYSELVQAIELAHRKVNEIPDIPLLLTQGGDDRVVDKKMARAWFNGLPIMDKYYKEWDGLFHEVLNEPEKEKVLAHMMGFVTIQLSMIK
ncbi:MAG: alpha/beta hydrolase [Bacillus sp. (in: Bacteria)]|nr:alpha/beta hydrolase [Bacillus sp. (in: firmicutes)]